MDWIVVVTRLAMFNGGANLTSDWLTKSETEHNHVNGTARLTGGRQRVQVPRAVKKGAILQHPASHALPAARRVVKR